MAFVSCSVAMGQKAPEYDTLVKRGRLRMGNLIKDEGFTQTTEQLRTDSSTFTTKF